MNTFLQILVDYWPYISTCILALLIFILLLIKRRPQTIDEFYIILNQVLRLIPGLVLKFERPGHGEEKKQAVIEACISNIKYLLHRSLSDYELDVVKRTCSGTIEEILAAPQKKGK